MLLYFSAYMLPLLPRGLPAGAMMPLDARSHAAMLYACAPWRCCRRHMLMRASIARAFTAQLAADYTPLSYAATILLLLMPVIRDIATCLRCRFAVSRAIAAPLCFLLRRSRRYFAADTHAAIMLLLPLMPIVCRCHDMFMFAIFALPLRALRYAAA